MTKTWIAQVEEDPEDPEQCILVFPPEMLAEVGWEVGDTLEWIDESSDEGGPRFIIKKV
jgi:hypothetical protein